MLCHKSLPEPTLSIKTAAGPAGKRAPHGLALRPINAATSMIIGTLRAGGVDRRSTQDCCDRS